MKHVLNSKEYTALNESVSDNQAIVEAFLKVGPIRMADGKIKQPSDFIDTVNSAFRLFEKQHPWEYQFIKHARILYLLDGRLTNTMCVDERGDVYINVEFIYSYLQMNAKYIMYILYHEAMHTILNHVERGKKYGVKNNNKLTWKEMNICADYEVNGQMVADHVCDENTWDILHGYYSRVYSGLTFEMIAEDKNKIKKNEKLVWNPEKHKNSNKSPEYEHAVKEMKNAIADLLKHNNNNKRKTVDQLKKIVEVTKNDYNALLEEIKNAISNSTMQYILKTRMFESAGQNDDRLYGLQDGFREGISKLRTNNKDISDMTAQEAADAAKDVADDLQDKANELQDKANDLQDVADEAKAKSDGLKEEADNAQQEADNAQNRANELKDAAKHLKELAEGAREKAENGEISQEEADNAQQEADNAQQEADNAQQEADNAQQEADNAQQEADNAQQEADNAQQEADNAQQEANDMQQDANDVNDMANDAQEAADKNDTEGARENAKNAKDIQNKNNSESDSSEQNGESENQDSVDDDYSDDDFEKELSEIFKDMDDSDTLSTKTDMSNVDNLVGRIIKPSELQNNLKDSLKESGYDTDDIESIYDDVMHKPQVSKEEMIDIRNDIMLNKPNSTLADLCKKVNVDETVTEEIWEELVKKFLERSTTRRGSDNTEINYDDIRWGNKRYLNMDDIVMPYNGKTSAAPQYINIFLDCSGSINANLSIYFLEIIEKLCDKLEFSGIRIIPFSDRVEESKIIGYTADELKKDEKAKTHLKNFIYECEQNNYGGGGNSYSFSCMAKYIHKCNTDEPESVYLVMTDGELFDTNNINKFKMFSERVLFCIANKNIKEQLKATRGSYIAWCSNPKYEYIDKVYIELNEVKY